ncbi:MAG: hypothetical protein KDA61_22125, partial [Planctomycetales bacterium]|nr:hypothetical protein [Planctomycetales bacterium]
GIWDLGSAVIIGLSELGTGTFQFFCGLCAFLRPRFFSRFLRLFAAILSSRHYLEPFGGRRALRTS